MLSSRIRPSSRRLVPTLATGLFACGTVAAAVPHDPAGVRGEVFVPAAASDWAFYTHDGWCWLAAFPDAKPGDAAQFISSHPQDFESFLETTAPALRPCAPDTRLGLCDGDVRNTGTHPQGTVLTFGAGHSRRLVATAGHGRRGDPAWTLQWSGRCVASVTTPVSSPDDPDGGGDGGESDADNDSGAGHGDAPDKGDNDSGDSGDSGGCFLTTAIVHRRGFEPDNGPTLTTLRRFRDRYMMPHPMRRELIAAYYAAAPAITAAIPANDPEWRRIAGAVDAAVAAINGGDDDAAFGIYAATVRQLAARWLVDTYLDWNIS